MYPFIQTNRFRKEHKQYEASITLPVDVPANATTVIVNKVLEGLGRI